MELEQTGDYADKPAYYVDGNIHAGEVTGCMTCVYVLWYALTHYGRDATITRLLDTRTLYVLPRISVDGSEKYLKTPYALRSSTRLYPFDEPQPGLHPEDVDGDGEILWMRLTDPNGSWKVSDLDPRLMVKRGPDEDGGRYYRLMREGLITDYGGREVTIAPARWGLDWNRNSPYDWQPEAVQEGAGPTPLSEPETRAVHDFIVAHRNICGAQSFHTFSGVILRPFSARADDDFPPADLEIYKKIGERGADIAGYKCISIYHDFRYESKQFLRGALLDWLYDHLGLFVFSTELWDVTKLAGVEAVDSIRFLMYERKPEDEKKLLDFSDRELGGEGFLPHKNAQFVYAHALMSPLIRMDDPAAEALGGDLYRVGCYARNYGFLATAVSGRAVERKAAIVEVALISDRAGTVRRFVRL